MLSEQPDQRQLMQLQFCEDYVVAKNPQPRISLVAETVQLQRRGINQTSGRGLKYHSAPQRSHGVQISAILRLMIVLSSSVKPKP